MRWILSALPAVLTLFFALLEGLAWRMPPETVPLLTLSAIYYWALYRPDLLTPVIVFFAGMLLDLLQGNPTGLSPLFFLAIYGFLRKKRHFWTTLPFSALWIRYGLTLSFFEGILFIIKSLGAGHFVSLLAFFLPALLTWAIYPYLSLFFSWIHKNQMQEAQP